MSITTSLGNVMTLWRKLVPVEIKKVGLFYIPSPVFSVGLPHPILSPSHSLLNTRISQGTTLSKRKKTRGAQVKQWKQLVKHAREVSKMRAFQIIHHINRLYHQHFENKMTLINILRWSTSDFANSQQNNIHLLCDWMHPRRGFHSEILQHLNSLWTTCLLHG